MLGDWKGCGGRGGGMVAQDVSSCVTVHPWVVKFRIQILCYYFSPIFIFTKSFKSWTTVKKSKAILF